MMSFSGGRGKLDDARQTALARWEAAGEQWNDQTRREHEEEVVIPLNDAAVELLRAVDRLTAVFGSARRDCEFDPTL
jgi:hypothetical protein